MSGPRFEHDCKECYFLGRVSVPDHFITEQGWAQKHYDLYYCRIGGLPDTVIARFGLEGDYYGGIVFAGMPGQPVIPPLQEALRRAIAYGLRGETGGVLPERVRGGVFVNMNLDLFCGLVYLAVALTLCVVVGCSESKESEPERERVYLQRHQLDDGTWCAIAYSQRGMAMSCNWHRGGVSP